METKIIDVSLNEVIHHDLESFLDLLEELFFSDVEEEKRYYLVLNNLSYKAIGFNSATNLIQLEVSGNVENM
jgi:hypothetical protein